MGQMDKFASADVILQERQLAASAAARRCDAPDGPMAIGYGGARGGGKSHWLLAQSRHFSFISDAVACWKLCRRCNMIQTGQRTF
jgi:hypothetical protein